MRFVVLTKNDHRAELRGCGLHVRIVQRYVGQMCGQEGVDAAAGAHQEHLGVDNAGAQRTGKDAGQIDDTYACGAVHHLQRHAKEQLYDNVEAQMEPVRVQEHIAEETPDLQAAIGSIDQHRIAGYGHRLAKVLGGHCVTVVGEDCNLKKKKNKKQIEEALAKVWSWSCNSNWGCF